MSSKKEPKGWYSKVIIGDSGAETRWISVENFFLSIFTGMKELTPLLLFHISSLEASPASKETGQLHSLRIETKHACNYQQFFIYTPNQFDIAAIARAIQQEQEHWTSFIQTEVSLPVQFPVDLTGRFLFRASDRMTIHIDAGQITVTQLGQEDIVVAVDSNLRDIHPTLENESDPRWLKIMFAREDTVQTLRLHTQSIEDLRKIVDVGLYSICRQNDGRLPLAACQ